MTRTLFLGCLVLASACLAFGQAGIGLVGGGAAPEIDPSQGMTVLALLSGGALVVRSRLKK